MGFWGGLGKILKVAAPIAASFIPGVGPALGALIGGAGSAAGSAMSGSGVKGSLINGLMGAGGGALSGGLGGASGAANGGKAMTGGSFLKGLLSGDGLSAIGTGLGAVSKSQASNRGTELEAMMAADEMAMRGRADRRTEESDLWRKLQAANYMKSGGRPDAPSKSTSGATLPTFGFGPAPISEEDKQMAATLIPQLQQRLNTPPALRDYDSKMKPGTSESIMNWLGPMFSGLGAVKSAGEDNQTTQAPPVNSSLFSKLFPGGGTAGNVNRSLTPFK